MPQRTVFFISDGTGITAETFGNAILAQFEMRPRHVRLPFIDSVDKAHQAVRQINHTAEVEGRRPIVFTTLVNEDVLGVIQQGCKGLLLDMFGTFVNPLEQELGITSNHRIGRFSDVSKSQEYHDRIEAINFSLAHDDGQLNRDLELSDVILIRMTSDNSRSRLSCPSSCARLKLMASIRSWYSWLLLTSEKRPMRWLDVMPSSCSRGFTKVPNMSSSRPLQPCWMTPSTSSLTKVVKTMGRRPSTSAVWLICLTA